MNTSETKFDKIVIITIVAIILIIVVTTGVKLINYSESKASIIDDRNNLVGEYIDAR